MTYIMHPDYKKRVEYCPAQEHELYYVWTRVKTRAHQTFPDRPRSSYLPEIRKWVDANTKDLWGCHINNFFFKDERDATWFRMRWG